MDIPRKTRSKSFGFRDEELDKPITPEEAELREMETPARMKSFSRLDRMMDQLPYSERFFELSTGLYTRKDHCVYFHKKEGIDFSGRGEKVFYLFDANDSVYGPGRLFGAWGSTPGYRLVRVFGEREVPLNNGDDVITAESGVCGLVSSAVRMLCQFYSVQKVADIVGDIRDVIQLEILCMRVARANRGNKYALNYINGVM